jgi:carbon-monoxide dehydrogenase small subunit/xanthine dehydrogenase small subunit
MRFTLNGEAVDVDVHPMARLLDVLRSTCGLTGSKEGCGEGECGACTVLVDGLPVNSCLIPVIQVEGAAVTTIEGLSNEPLRHAFVEHGAAQCGICTPGMMVTASVIPAHVDVHTIRTWLAGNLCRCTGYAAIVRAVQSAHKHEPVTHKGASGHKHEAKTNRHR